MAFGMHTDSGNFLPIVKYDARAGRLFRVDKSPSGENTSVDITGPETKFAVDLGSLQVGYVQFTANGPMRTMVPYGQPLPPQPRDKDDAGKLLARPGFYTLIAGNALGGVREWCSNASIVVNALDDLWQKFAAAPEAAAGKVPLVIIASIEPITSGNGSQKSTNYRPVMAIVGWVDRLAEMGERTVPAPAAAKATAPPPAPASTAPVHHPQASQQLPPSGMPF